MKHVKRFLIFAGLLNSPAIFVWLPFIKLFFVLPFLFWIKIPTQWLALAGFMGSAHYEASEFGAWPKTPVAWLVIFLFWTLVAVALTLLTAVVPRLQQRFGFGMLFIVTSLLAVALGLGIWLAR